MLRGGGGHVWVQMERLLYLSFVIRAPAGAPSPPARCPRRGAWAGATYTLTDLLPGYFIIQSREDQEGRRGGGGWVVAGRNALHRENGQIDPSIFLQSS